LPDLAQCADLPPETLAERNPALMEKVRSGRLYVPRGYRLQLPDGTRSDFEVCYANLPSSAKHDEQRRTYVAHRVKRGQTLAWIARRYGVSVATIERSNPLRRGRIHVGQNLLIPTG